MAVRVGVQEIVEFLTDHGADVNAKDREGRFQKLVFFDKSVRKH